MSTKKPARRIKPYEGDKPFIFISYRHKNKEAVMPILKRMQSEGFRFWYDEGITPGVDWDTEIAKHIVSCGYFLSLLSPEYIGSSNCMDELNYARTLEKDRLLVYLAPTELPAGLSMRLGRLQAIHAYEYEEEDFFEKLFSAQGFDRFRGEPTEEDANAASAADPTPTAKAKKATRSAKKSASLRSETATADTEAPVPTANAEVDLTESAEPLEELSGAPIVYGASVSPNGVSVQPPLPPRAEDESTDTVEDAVDLPHPYEFPPLSLLRSGEPMPPENEEELIDSVKGITEVLRAADIKIVGDITYSRGPTATRYEMTPASGVRMSKLRNLSDELALTLGVWSGIRIVSPIPGTNLIGIEVPNRERHTVYLRDLLESPDFLQSNAPLTAALGVDISGKPTVFDLAKMPHLLVAGQTGSGKTVGIQCILASLLYRNRPDDLRLVLIDPKQVEFFAYKGIPHLYAPIVNSARNAACVLRALVDEMERRYNAFQLLGVRDLKRYNVLRVQNSAMKRLPHIVVVIDELSDLMLAAKADVEPLICQLAQKARAAGIHLVIGTQRPSVDVITGVIKANIPSVIAFKVTTYADSRLLLDGEGGEKLAGRGDMIFSPVGSVSGARVQGAYVSDNEIEAICDFIRRANGAADYDEHIIKQLSAPAKPASKASGRNRADTPAFPDENADDPLYIDAARFVITHGTASISLLQRKFDIGFARSARLIDRMTHDGVISEPNGSQPRTVLLTLSQFLDRILS